MALGRGEGFVDLPPAPLGLLRVAGGGKVAGEGYSTSEAAAEDCSNPASAASANDCRLALAAERSAARRLH